MMKLRSKNDASYKKFGKHSDSEEEEETELLLVRNKSPKKEIPTVEKVVEEGDTLQSLAIRYRCTIEDLKRLNNIHKENEIFAKRTIKVPHYPITMALAGVHVSGRSSPNNPATSGIMDTEKLTSSLKETEVNQIIFNSHISQINHDDDCEEHIINDEEIRLLPQERVTEPVTTKIDCSGVDGDISLKALILVIVILIFAVPLIYVFYIAEHIENYHHNHSYNS